ncbi:MAG: transcription termination/antitermination protein NusG [Coprobacillus sp.]|nr:transcription termination/antitermination protein NusG [Coprobacillus sp.]
MAEEDVAKREDIYAVTDSSTDESVGRGASSSSGEKAWFVVTSYSTHEAKVKENIERRMQSMGMGDLIFRTFVGEVEVPVLKNGEPTGKTKMKNLYPSYIFVEMIMTDKAWYVVRNTPGVTGFVGSSGKGTKPFPVPREQMEPVLKRLGIIDESMYDRYKVGDAVKIISGPFDNTEGNIISLDKDSGQVEVEIYFFGRPSRVTVEFSQIEKA